MAYEDFTTYTEVDVNDRISKTAQHIDFVTYRSNDANDKAFLYSDKGAAHFGDFEHLIDVRVVSGSWAGHFWALSNDVVQIIDDTLHISGMMYGLNNFTYLRETYSGSTYTDHMSFVDDTWYYYTIKKTGTTLTMKVYSDSARTNLLDTLALTLHADHTFRYVYGSSTHWYSDANILTETLDIDNLDLQEGGNGGALTVKFPNYYKAKFVNTPNG